MLTHRRLRDIFEAHCLKHLSLRESDKRELCTASGFDSPWLALKQCIAHSSQWTEVTFNEEGRPIMVHGLGAHGDMGIPWMVGSDEMVDRYKLTLVKYSYKIIDEMHETHPRLGNIVDHRNVVHIRWLKAMGFIFDPKTNIILNKNLFLGFFKIKE